MNRLFSDGETVTSKLARQLLSCPLYMTSRPGLIAPPPRPLIILSAFSVTLRVLCSTACKSSAVCGFVTTPSRLFAILSMRALVVAMFATVARRLAAASPSPEKSLTMTSTSCAALERLTDSMDRLCTMRLISPSLRTAIREKAPVMSRTLLVMSFRLTAVATSDVLRSGLLMTPLMPFSISCACSTSTDSRAITVSMLSSGVPATRSPSSR